MLLFFGATHMLQTEPVAHGLNTGGWVFITIAWTAIISVAVFCYSRVIRIAEQRKRAAAVSAASETMNR